MDHRRFSFGRFVLFLLLIGGLIAAGRGLFRSGYEQGFVSGMAFSAADGESPPAVYGAWRGGGPGLVERGFMGLSVLGFAFVAFMALMLMGACGRRRWAHHSPHHHGPRGHGGWGDGRHGGKAHTSPGPDDIGPEKQPESFI